jgi:hypothetical protein
MVLHPFIIERIRRFGWQASPNTSKGFIEEPGGDRFHFGGKGEPA